MGCLTAPLLVMPDDRNAGGLPCVASLDQVTATVRRLNALGVRGVKVVAYGTARDASANAATGADNLMCRAVEQIESASSERLTPRR